jgi:hypothetical protein
MIKQILKLFPYVQQLKDERDKALTGELNLVDLHCQNGRINATFKTKVAQLLVEWAEEVLGDAPNYVEISMINSETSERYIVTVQRANGKTPHELRREAEQKLTDYQKNHA